ncbi:hypothetical protein VPHK460_0154 [Vibrio phage K460]
MCSCCCCCWEYLKFNCPLRELVNFKRESYIKSIKNLKQLLIIALINGV